MPKAQTDKRQANMMKAINALAKLEFDQLLLLQTQLADHIHQCFLYSAEKQHAEKQKH
jgi:hypothetical protein